MGEFINNCQRRPSREYRIEIHFFQQYAAILDCFPGNDREALQQSFRFQTMMSFYKADHDIDTFGQSLPGFLKHRICFTDTRAHPEKYFKLAACSIR
jgi:hypothetical protein